MYDLTFQQFVLLLIGYAIFVSLITLLFDYCAKNKLDFAPIFWTSFLLTPLFGALMAIVNIIAKQTKEDIPKTNSDN